MNGTRRADVERGMCVAIVQKQDQHTGRLTEGYRAGYSDQVGDAIRTGLRCVWRLAKSVESRGGNG